MLNVKKQIAFESKKMTDFAYFSRKLNHLSALPLRAVPSDSQRARRAALAKERSQPLASNLLDATDACDLFLRNNGLNERAFRLLGADYATVERRSIEAPRVGHPFMDALLAAHEHGVAFTLAPNDVWELVWRAVSIYVRQHETTANRLVHAQRGFARSPDGTMRICLSTLGHNELLDGCLDDVLWMTVRKELLESIDEMGECMTSLAVPQCDEKCQKRGTHCLSTGKDHSRRTIQLDKESTKMPPVNLIAEQRALPLPETSGKVIADESLMPGIERLMLQGSLREWVDLLHAVDAIADFPTFADWCTRVVWLLYHFILHYERFTPDKSKRPPIAESVHAKLRALAKSMSLADNMSHFAGDFFGVQREGAVHLCGSALLLFPHEAGYLRVSPPSRAQCATESVDFDWNVCGIDVAAFNNAVSAVEAFIDTPDCDIPILYVHGAFGWVYHSEKRVIEVARMSAVVFGEREVRVPALVRSSETEEKFVAAHVEEIARDSLVLRSERTEAVNNLMQLLDECNGDVDTLIAFSENNENLATTSLRDWPPPVAAEERISAWRSSRDKERESTDEFIAKDDNTDDDERSGTSELVGEAPGSDLDAVSEDASASEISGAVGERHTGATEDEPEQQPAASDNDCNDFDAREEIAAVIAHVKSIEVALTDATQKHEEQMRVIQEVREQEQKQHKQQMAEMHANVRRLEEQICQVQEQMKRDRQAARKSAEAREQRVEERLDETASRSNVAKSSALACEAEILRIKATLNDIPELLMAATASCAGSRCTNDKEASATTESDTLLSDDDTRAWQRVGAKSKVQTEAPDCSSKSVAFGKFSSVEICDIERLECVTLPAPVQPKRDTVLPDAALWALPLRIVATGGVDEKHALADFGATLLHMSVRRPCNAQHFCAQHRNSALAPASIDDFYDRVTDGTVQMSLFELLSAIADQEIACARCQSAQSGDQTRLLHGGLDQCAEEAPSPLPEFVRSLYNMLASIDGGGSAFRACSVCRREFHNDSFRIALFVLGVTAAGTVRVRIALRCDDADAQKRCGTLLLQHFEGPDRSAPGLALSVSRLNEWSRDFLVRVHASGDCSVRDTHDLILHACGGAQPQPFIYKSHASLARRWSAHRHH